MNYDIKKDVPPYVLSFEDTKKFIDIFQSSLELIHDDISGYVKQFDLEKCEEKYLDLMLYESGWNLKIELDENLKRKVIRMAYYIYSRKGIEEGLEFILGYFTRLPIQVNDTVKEGFPLGEVGSPPNNSLGVDTVLGFGGFYLHFIVHTPILTPEQLVIVDEITSYMKWAVNTYEIKQDLVPFYPGYHEISSFPIEFFPAQPFFYGFIPVDYSLDVEVDDILFQVVINESGFIAFQSIAIDIQNSLRALTGNLETVDIVNNRIRITSASVGIDSSIVMSPGTKSGAIDIISYWNSDPSFNVIFHTPVPGGGDY